MTSRHDHVMVCGRLLQIGRRTAAPLIAAAARLIRH